MNTPTGNFGDLGPRLVSGLVMAVSGIAGVWAGGVIFAILVAALSGLMVWELARLLDQRAPFGKAEAAGFSAAVALFVFDMQFSGLWLFVAMALAVGLLAWRLERDRAIGAAYLALILFAGVGLLALRSIYGWELVLWLVLVVVGSDVAGYFAGRLLGGPKLWPRVSPKKTWSGTVAGWGLAAVLGWGFAAVLGVPALGMIAMSVLLSMAGQAGDIAESALKRHAGVKDSSNLIPGHGGVMDRFDAMIAAALMALILSETGVLAMTLRCWSVEC